MVFVKGCLTTDLGTLRKYFSPRVKIMFDNIVSKKCNKINKIKFKIKLN